MIHIKTISDFHRFLQLPAPAHPLLSIIDVATVPQKQHRVQPENMMLDFYSVSVKRMHNVRVQYGQQPFYSGEGIMSFMAPKQVFSMAVDQEEEVVKKSGWVIYIHPDFIWNTALAKTIKHYDFWGYALQEALFLSPREESIMNGIRENIVTELDSNMDRFSKQIIISQIESLLTYGDRFYHRQFLTREKANHHLLAELETLLNNYLNSPDLASRGVPTVQYVSEALHLSANYLRSLLKVLTGQNTQQYIHEKLIEKAKEKLSTTALSVSEIAYELGFDYPQSFSSLFKKKTAFSPLAFRQSFN